MKKVLTLILSLCFCLALAACGGPTDEEIQAVRDVSFEGTELTVTLGTNQSTGYEWEYNIQGDCIEASINRVFTITGSEGDATGELAIGFKGTGAGTATIVFTTPNGWDGTGEGDGYTVTVEVGDDGTILSAEGVEGTAKITLAIDEIAEGAYTGTLSGCDYSSSSDESTYMIHTKLSPAELTVTVKGGQVELYCEAEAVAGGEILGVETPDSPAYTMIASGTLTLSQTDEQTVSAEGELECSGGDPWINWDGNKKFTHWDIEEYAGDSTYHCTVTVTLADGVPTAEIPIDGSASQRTATVPLALTAAGE